MDARLGQLLPWKDSGIKHRIELNWIELKIISMDLAEPAWLWDFLRYKLEKVVPGEADEADKEAGGYHQYQYQYQDMNKVLLKDTKPAQRPTFSLGPPDPLPPPGPGPSKLTISAGTKSAFEVSQDFPPELESSFSCLFWAECWSW